MSDTPDPVTVLMTGAGAPGASGVARSLYTNGERPVRVVGVDMDPDAYGFSLVDTGYTVPGGDEAGYVERMLEVAAEEAVDVVLPLTTAELSPLAGARDRFDATVAVSAPDALATANDKGALYSMLADEGFDCAPAFRRVDTESGLVAACEALGYPDRPVCFKRPVASGMRGFRVLDPDADRLTRLLEQKPDAAVTTLEEVRPVLAGADRFPELVVMEYLPGREYSVDVLAQGDTAAPVIPRTRARTRAGISFEGVVEENDELRAAARGVCRRLGLEYNVNLQFRYNAAGEPRLIEINPRVSGTIVACVGAGANMPYYAVNYALGDPVPEPDVEWGTRMVRYWQELFHGPEGETYHVPRGSVGWHP